MVTALVEWSLVLVLMVEGGLEVVGEVVGGPVRGCHKEEVEVLSHWEKEEGAAWRRSYSQFCQKIAPDLALFLK